LRSLTPQLFNFIHAIISKEADMIPKDELERAIETAKKYRFCRLYLVGSSKSNWSEDIVREREERGLR
jgi:hypothetical protein